MKTRYELWEYSQTVSRCIAIRQSHEIDKKHHMKVGESKTIARYIGRNAASANDNTGPGYSEHVLSRIK